MRRIVPTPLERCAPALTALTIVWALAACEGVIGEGAGGPTPVDPTRADGGNVESTEMGETPLHRLNQVELVQTVTDLFGPEAASQVAARVDPRMNGFDTHAGSLTMSESSIDGAMRMAESLAQNVPEHALEPCAGDATERDCAQVRIAALAPRVLRRPLEPEELGSLLTMWDEIEAREDATIATQAVWQRLLMSPDFLYHVEVGDSSGRLTDAELANRLSYLLWESMPDAALFAARDEGRLATPEGVRAEIERMLAAPRGLATMQRFFEQWADLDRLDTMTKDAAIYPEFDALRAPMRQEFLLFVGDLIENDGTVSALFTSRETFADEALAELYGVPHPGGGFARITLPEERVGVLGQAAFLAIHGKANKSSPILRGVFVLDRVLCESPPPPPPGIVGSDAVAVTTTTRALIESMTSPPPCMGCHSQINPIGFTFESFDGMGAHRSIENGEPVDTSGAVTMGDAAGDVAGSVELAEALGRSVTVRECLATQWFRSRFRRVESGQDVRVIDAFEAALDGSGDRIRALATALADQPSLYHLHYREPR